MYLGPRHMTGSGNLLVHKRLDNLVAAASSPIQSHVEGLPIEPCDWCRPALPRSAWLRYVGLVDYAERLSAVGVTTLLVVGRHDPQTPMPCSTELAARISRSELAVFEDSGHSPFVEEPGRFAEIVGGFLAGPVTAS